MILSQRLPTSFNNPLNELIDRGQRLALTGRDIVPFSVGEPDGAPPQVAKDAAIAAIRENRTGYPPANGTPVLRRAIQRRLLTDYGVEYASEQVLVTTGGLQGIANAFRATLDPGDEVLLLAPFWAQYKVIAGTLGARPVIVGSSIKDGFRPDIAELEASISASTKWLVINSPSNPTGAVIDEDIEAISAVLARHPHVHILLDGIYRRLTFEGRSPEPIARFASLFRDRVLIIDGVSKTFAMTGWRLGYAAGPQWLIDAIAFLQGQSTYSVNAVSQAAAEAALLADDGYVAQELAKYERKRDLICDELAGLPGVVCHRPEGAFYVFPSFEAWLGQPLSNGKVPGDDLELALLLLEDFGVATVPGSAFGAQGHLRLSFALPNERIIEGVRRLTEAAGAAVSRAFDVLGPAHASTGLRESFA